MKKFVPLQSLYMVDVVQLVEHRIVVPSVVGSSPIIHPKNIANKFCGLKNSPYICSPFRKERQVH